MKVRQESEIIILARVPIPSFLITIHSICVIDMMTAFNRWHDTIGTCAINPILCLSNNKKKHSIELIYQFLIFVTLFLLSFCCCVCFRFISIPFHSIFGWMSCEKTIWRRWIKIHNEYKKNQQHSEEMKLNLSSCWILLWVQAMFWFNRVYYVNL